MYNVILVKYNLIINNSQMQAHKTLMNYAIAKCANATLNTCNQQFGSIQTDITLNISLLRKKAV